MLRELERSETERYFTADEMADILDVCADTVRRYLKQKGFKGQLTNIAPHRNVYLYSHFEFQTVKDMVETTKVVEKNYYTASQVADMAGCTTSWISAIAAKNKIPHVYGFNKGMRVSYYAKDKAEELCEIIRQKKEKAKTKSETVKIQEETLENHPLVKDARFLKLSYFPDVVPQCFEDIDSEIIL